MYDERNPDDTPDEDAPAPVEPTAATPRRTAGLTHPAHEPRPAWAGFFAFRYLFQGVSAFTLLPCP